jgi:protease I
MIFQFIYLMQTINSKKVAVLIADGFEQSEFEEPVKALSNAGATVDIVSLKKGKVTGWKNKNWGNDVDATVSVEETTSDRYDILILPGGVMSPDKLRTHHKAVEFVKGFFDQQKPIAAICHAPWLLIETGYVKGKKVTSYPSVKTDLMNAGAI